MLIRAISLSYSVSLIADIMAELDLVACVIAVVDLSAKIASTCVQYSRDVKDSKADIGRFKQEVESVDNLLRHAKALLEGADKTSLSTLDELKNALAECETQLQQLNRALDPGNRWKGMSKIEVRALEWPFKSREVDKAISSLGRSRATTASSCSAHRFETCIRRSTSRNCGLHKHSSC